MANQAALYRAGDKKRVVVIKSSADAAESYRTCWRRDYARLIHSAAFRRLQGKTQLFPGDQSDFFRNRLTHSLEVAQVAKSIAIRLNNTDAYFMRHNIDTDLIETAALAHDLGHPPFGHNGEAALNECMREAGGFEGNAQTLRILSKLEKRDTKTADQEIPTLTQDNKDNRAGLNLTYRTLASVLKYDFKIPHLQTKPHDHGLPVIKGYYYTEQNLVADIKKNVAGSHEGKFKTIECSIMDIADDIAYSTYDLEDSFKAAFLTPLSMLSAPPQVIDKVASEVKDRINKYYPDLNKNERRFDSDDVYRILTDVFSEIYSLTNEDLKSLANESDNAAAIVAGQAASSSSKMASNGYYRTKLTSDLVGKFIRGVVLSFNNKKPALSSVRLEISVFKQVEVLKNFAFQSLIMSPRLKVAEHRGKDIVTEIFRAISEDDGCLLMPEDFQNLYLSIDDAAEKRRVVCDFIAGMTDRYAVQFYSRLYGTNPESIFQPL